MVRLPLRERLFQWAPAAWRGDSGLILLYHRVADLDSDPQQLAVSPRRFAQHMEVIASQGTPSSLRGLPTALANRQRPPIAVTFDDGYADVAASGPQLACVGATATMFVTTSYLGGAREFWWDDLERLLLLPGRLPETLRLPIGARIHEWHLGEAKEYGDAERRRDLGWHVECSGDPSPRHRAYRDLCRLLRGVEGDERVRTLDALSAMAGAGSEARPTHRPISEDDLARAEKSGTFDVGAHTETHAALSALPADVQRREISNSKAKLETIVGHRIASFAYPFGGRADYTATSTDLVRESGFTVGCTAAGGLVCRKTDRFQWPRMLVRNWDVDTFAAKLRAWLGR
jgi:peptidoglycan/xylan/chitin deacetylase (PgdA/CDA1 family)